MIDDQPPTAHIKNGLAGSAQAERMCPSTPTSNATVFLGMITPAGKVAYITPAVPASVLLSETDTAAEQPLEATYRFAGPCVTAKCGFWTTDHCGLGAKLVESFKATGAEPVDLPKCAIRRTCRWFTEQGPAACSPCSYVVTDAR